MDRLKEALQGISAEKVLDLGTRDGSFAAELYQDLGYCGHITAMDITDAMFEAGREKCAGMPVDFVVGDATAIPYPDDSFDLVAIANSLHHIPDLGALLREMRRVLKPEGTLVLCEMYCDAQPAGSLTYWIFHDIECTMHTIEGKYHHHTYSKAQIGHMVRAAGFRIRETFTDRKSDAGAVFKISERLDALPKELERHRNCVQYPELKASYDWFREELEQNGLKAAEQLVILAGKTV